MEEIKLMKGNEAIAHAAIRCGCDGYFGYPITPQTEVLETLMELKPWETTGMVVLQAESETASVNMLYGGASAGKKVMTSSSSPGISLMCEGLSYLAAAGLPCVIVDVMRGGPGLGTIQPGQADYFQVTKGGGHGDYHTPVLAPSSVQEMSDFVEEAFHLAFKYRTPVIILSDGVIGQMMEKVRLRPAVKRLSEEEIIEKWGDWAVTGKKNRKRNIVTSVHLDSNVQESVNENLTEKYKKMAQYEVKYEEIMCDDAEYIIVAYGSSARICEKSVEIARQSGKKVGLFRPITLYPFPKERINDLSKKIKGFMCVELSTGQMIEDVRLSCSDRVPVEFYGRTGGIVYTPEEVYEVLNKTFYK